MPTTIINKHFMELVAPKQNSTDPDADFAKFEERYRLFTDNDNVVCITDNPMSHLSYMAPELIEVLGLPVNADNLMVHLNTFHRKTSESYVSGKEQNEQDLDILLQHAAALGIRYLLCVSGDGSDKLPRLRPEALGYDPQSIQTVTSVQLLEYIGKRYPGVFTCGVAFNQYEPEREEMEKLEAKVAAGASFVITQSVVVNDAGDAFIGKANENLEKMIRFADGKNLQVILEAWMSAKLAHLMAECVGYDIDFSGFDPWANLKGIRGRYPERKLYFSMVFGERTLSGIRELL